MSKEYRISDKGLMSRCIGCDYYYYDKEENPYWRDSHCTIQRGMHFDSCIFPFHSENLQESFEEALRLLVVAKKEEVENAKIICRCKQFVSFLEYQNIALEDFLEAPEQYYMGRVE